MSQIERLKAVITHSGKTYLRLESVDGKSAQDLSVLPPCDQARLLRAWAEDVRDEGIDFGLDMVLTNHRSE